MFGHIRIELFGDSITKVMHNLTSGANKTTYDMITIINKYTGEEICKYSSALVSESTNDSFIAPVKASGIFRGRWNAVVDYFIVLGDGKGGYTATQCLLKDQYAVKECLNKK